MTSKDENDLWTYGAIGAIVSAGLGLLISALAKSPPSFNNIPVNNGFPVNSYQATSSYTPPAAPKTGCGCGASRV